MSDKNQQTPTQQVSGWLAALDAALKRGDAAGAAALFGDDSYWRDLVSFTWNITTAEGKAKVRQQIEAAVIPAKPSVWQIDGEAGEANGVIEGWFRFETAVARGYGQVRLKDGKAWTLLTTMQELKGHEEHKGATRDQGVEHLAQRGRKSWLEERQQEEAELGITTQPYVLIIGGGQGGIMLAARLRRLKVPTIIVEKNERPGDNWRKRYKGLCLHDPVWYDHLPYLPFPEHWPVYSPKDKIADWLEAYVKIMELNYWSGTECNGARYDEAKKEWTVEVVRQGKPLTLRPRQLVLATGGSGFPKMPSIPGMETFKGDLHHSSQHPGPDGYKGKKTVVIGCTSSGHDICEALWEADADVTMVQRGSAMVGRADTLMALSLAPLYSEAAVKAGITTDRADLILASVPYKVLPSLQTAAVDELKRQDAEFYARLEKIGFKLDFGVDGSGIYMKALRVGGGYYIDTGASDLLIDGKIKLKSLKSGVDIERIGPHAIHFTDGSELPADLIVFATGYGTMDNFAVQFLGREVADKVGRVWGLGSDTRGDPGPWEGEPRNMWKPTHQEAFWFHGGNLALSRHYSQFLSLQLKARMEGIPTPVYGLAPVHHKAAATAAA
jgi:putative flavoprotein involved in K+ transport